MEEVLPALTAGVVSTILCNPLDTLRVNYQLGNKLKYNIKYMYRGIQYGILAIPTFWVIYFPVYKKLKDEEINKSLSAYVACCISSTFTTPFWSLRQAAQTNKKINTSISNLYAGLLPTYLINLSFTIQIPVYEYLKSNCENNTFNTFICTAISKTLAACVFYPLDTIRARIRDGQISVLSRNINYYKGISFYLVKSLPYHVSVFCTYEFVKKNLT